jgi:hypothetical protein
MKREPADPKKVKELVASIKDCEKKVQDALDTVSRVSELRRQRIADLAKLVGAAQAGELLGQHRQSIYRAMSLTKKD